MLSKMTKIDRKTLIQSKKKLQWKKPRKLKAIYIMLKNQVKTFLEREDNSRQLPGKADAVKVDGQKEKVQKSVLNDFMDNLFLKFKAENPAIKISRATFFSLRPKYLSFVNFAARVTCLCTKHQNFALKLKCLKSLNVNTVTSPDVFTEKNGGTDIKEILSKINVEKVNFQEWKRIKGNDGKQRTKLINSEMNKQFCRLFQSEFDLFCEHAFRVKIQYQQFRNMKDQVLNTNHHVLIQMDFAENYTCQVMEEIQSAYWNADMYTLHPAVIYYRNNDQAELSHKSFVFFSDILHHNTAFVSVVIHKMMEEVKRLCPEATHVHYYITI